MNIGDKVLYNGEVATLVEEVRPACKCKGKGHYTLQIEGSNFRKEVPITTILEPYTPLGMNLKQHKF